MSRSLGVAAWQLHKHFPDPVLHGNDELNRMTYSIMFSSCERRTKLLVDLFSHGMTLNLC